MIEYLKGQLVASYPGKAVVEVGGAGISIEMPAAEDKLSSLVGQEVTIYTRLLIRDDEMIIYGFRAVEERKLFNLILGVGGFGPRLALSLLGLFSVSELYVAVLEENVSQLCRAHGIGRKAAQRLILEIKEKLPRVISAEELGPGPVLQDAFSVSAEVTEALCALGYSSAEAAAAVAGAVESGEDLTREELLKLALKSMAGR